MQTADLHRYSSRFQVKFQGVRWNKSARKWEVALYHDGQRHYLGRFAEDKEEDAARAYDTAARNLRGTNAHGGRDKGGGLRWWLNYPTPAEVASATCLRVGARCSEQAALC